MDLDTLLLELDKVNHDETTETSSSHDKVQKDVSAKRKQGRPFGTFKGYRQKSPVPAQNLTARQQKLKEKLGSAEDQGESSIESKRSSYPFSKEDKKKIAKALNTYGYNDLSAIKKLLPNKKMADIEKYLLFCRQKGMSLPYTKNYFRKINKLSNLDSWTTAVQNTRSRLHTDELVMAIEEISKNEKHPPPSSCGGVDFEKMYNYLAQVCRGDVPIEMPAQNYALLKSSFKMLQDYKEHMPHTAAYHKHILELKSFDVPNFFKPGVKRTYHGKEKTNTDEQSDGEYKYQQNPLQINSDLLVMDNEEVSRLQLDADFPIPIPSKRGKEKILFQPDGYPVQRDLVMTALRAEERPVLTFMKCDGSDLFVKMPYATKEDLKKAHYTSEDASPFPLNSLTFNIDAQCANLMTTVMPEAIVDKRCRVNSSRKPYLLNIQDSKSSYLKPKVVLSLPYKPAATSIKYHLKPEYVDPFIVNFIPKCDKSSSNSDSEISDDIVETDET